MTIEAIRELVTSLSASTFALAALGAALEKQTTAARLDPAIGAEVDHLLRALGVPEMLSGVGEAELKPVIADMRTTLLQSAKFLSNPASGSGWTHAEPEILQSQGEFSAGLPVSWKKTIVPRLEGLSDRLASSNGTFLDVGVGVGALSITMARLWPSLRVVGIDPWAPALAIARENVRKAELLTRIELREQAVQDLSDTEVFDLAWLPTRFINATLIRAAVERIHRALRFGGWILVSTANPALDPVVASFSRLRAVLCGGCSTVPAETEALLNDVGYGQVHTLRSSPTASSAITVGCRT